MKKLIFGLLAFAVLACGFAGEAKAGIINGSFEDPIVPVAGFTNFLGGSTAITGWTVVGVDSAVANGQFSQSGITFQAQAGNQWIDMAGVTSNSKTSGVSQNVATAIGTTYLLSFYVGSATDRELFFASTVDLSIDGGARTSYTNSTAPTNMLDWKLFNVSFIATGTTTNITFFNGSEPNNFLGALDNVSIQESSPVPEPASMSLLALGAAGMLGFRLRRRNKVVS